MMVLPLMGQKGEIIPLTKHIGFTLDAEENLYYEVFPDIPNFKSAQFFEINNNRIEARITFIDYTKIKVSRKAYNVKQLIRLQNQLNQKPMLTDEIRRSYRENLTYLRTKEILDNIPTGQYVSVKHQNGKWINGTLLSYRNDKLLLQTPFAVRQIPITNMAVSYTHLTLPTKRIV